MPRYITSLATRKLFMELQASHMTPWPSGLRRYVQVVVYFCGRRFESPDETPAEVKE